MRLVAYVSGTVLSGGALRGRLAERLPEHMVPAGVVVLEALPQSASGKLDRAALPPPRFDEEGVYEAPQGKLAAALAALWGQVLELPRVGRHDIFFALGGHSLLAMQML